MSNGVANVLHGDNSMTIYEDAAVVSLTSQGQWKIRASEGTDDSSQKFIFIFQSDDETCAERALTLGDESSGDPATFPVTVQALESTPSDNQLWTLEESAILERLPPIVIARIQSVKKPEYSLAIGGDLPLPRLYLGVAAVPNEKGSASQKWRLDYVSIE